MKKITIVLLLLCLSTVYGYARTVWTGSQVIDWNADPGQYLAIDANTLGTVYAGDCVVLNYTVTTDEGYPQVRLNDGSWNMLQSSSLNTSMVESRFYLTVSNATALVNGIIVTGYGLTLTSIEVVEGDQGDYSNSVWIGEQVFGSSWSVWQKVESGSFANAIEGYYIRAKFRDLKAGAQLSMSDGDWTVLPGTTQAANIAGSYVQYEITDEMLNLLKTKGLIISGTNFTLTSVEIIDPTTLRPLTLSVPVTQNWVYAEKPEFTVHVENPYDENIIARIVVAIATDKMQPETTLNRNVEITANGEEDIVVTATDNLDPGIYKATITVNDDLARAFFFAVNPTEIVSAPDKQADFDTYWAAAKEQLAAVEATDEPTLTEIPSKSTATRKVYLVQFKSIPDGTSGEAVTVRGYYCEPTDGQKHPVIMHYLGYDSGYRPGGEGTTPYCPSGDGDTSNYAEFYLSCRGQSVNNRPAAERDDGVEEDFTNTYGDWFAFNFGNKDSYYYRGAYMDCVRAIDFMASRPTSDMTQLYAEGQSQGGAFTVAAAALSGRTFKAIAPAITFMGDFPDYFDIVNWPAYVARENQGTMTDEEMFAFLSYFDTKNLATLISCPIITSVGLQDNVCPMHTNLAPYNNVTTPAADKQIIYNPELLHQTPSNWFSTYMSFFQNYATPAEDVVTIWEPTAENPLQSNDWNNWAVASYDKKGELANVRMNDIIRVTIAATDENSGTIKVANPDGWTALDASAEDNNVSSSTTHFDYTISSAKTLELIQQSGVLAISSKNFTISKIELVRAADRYDAIYVTIGSDGIASYSNGSKKFSVAGTGIKAYYASAVNTGTVELTAVDYVYGWQGYIVKGAEGTYDIAVYTGEEDYTDYPNTNYLKPSGDYSTNVAASEVGTYHYIFGKGDEGLGFYKLTANHTLAAHRAYLETTTDITPGGGPKVQLHFPDETTGIDTLNDERGTLNDGHVYDLSGRRINGQSSIINGQWSMVNSKLPKGIYIQNGKKFIVK